MRAASSSSPAPASCSGLAPGLLFGPLVGLAPWPAAAPTAGRPRSFRARARCRRPGSPSRSSALTAGFVLLRGRRSAAPAPSWACGQLVEPRLQWTSAGFTKPLRLVLEAVLRPQREIVGARRRGGVLQEVPYSGHVPHLIDDASLPAGTRAALAAARARAAPAEREAGHVRRVPGRARHRAPRRGADRSDRVSDRRRSAAGAAQVVGGLAARAAPPGPRPALEGAPAGPTRADAASAVPRAAPALGQEHGHVEGTTRRLPAGAGRRRRGRCARPCCSSRAAATSPELGRRARRARARRPARARALRRRGCGVGHGQRLRADGREPRPHALRSSSRRRSCSRSPSPRSWRGRPTCAGVVAATAGTRRLVEPGARARRDRVRARRPRRDRPAAGRQPRHAPRADDDPRGPAARVRGTRPRLPAVGRRRAPLARARARRAGLPAARSAASGGSSALLPARPRRPLRGARARRDARREDARSCSCRACSRSGAVVALLGIVTWLVETA